MQRIIHNDLKLFPYKVQILQNQTDANKKERSEFCQTIIGRIENNSGDLGLILFSDEAHFHLSGPVNKQNMRFWPSQQPLKHTQQHKSGESYSFVCYRQRMIFGRYVFEDNGRNRVTVNVERYVRYVYLDQICNKKFSNFMLHVILYVLI